jgi:hypothetical protein
MGERLKPAVLKSVSAHSGKCIKIKQILLPAKHLRPFFVSPDFTDFHPI